MSRVHEDGQGFALPPALGTLSSSSAPMCWALPSHHGLELDFGIVLSLVGEFLVSFICTNVCKPSCIWICIIKLGNKDLCPKQNEHKAVVSAVQSSLGQSQLLKDGHGERERMEKIISAPKPPSVRGVFLFPVVSDGSTVWPQPGSLLDFPVTFPLLPAFGSFLPGNSCFEEQPGHSSSSRRDKKVLFSLGKSFSVKGFLLCV